MKLTADEIKKMSLSEFVYFLDSMTTTELILQFPNRFHLPLAGNSIDSNANMMVANQAILFEMVKDHNKLSASQLKEAKEIINTNEVDGICFVCNEPTSNLSANPSKWCMFMPHIDGWMDGKFTHDNFSNDLESVIVGLLPDENTTDTKVMEILNEKYKGLNREIYINDMIVDQIHLKNLTNWLKEQVIKKLKS